MDDRFEPVGLADMVEIADGVRMPRLGLGTYRSADGPQVEHEVGWALAIGYRAIDTASLYGNEAGVGRAIAASGLAREELFVATKVWNDEQGYTGTLEACERSLGRLGLEYADLYLVHWPIPELMRDTWRAMEELVSQGRVRAIGVCNFLEHHLGALLSLAEVPPAVNQFEHHPRLQQPGLVEYCERAGVVVQAWAPIMRGRVLKVAELVEIGRRHGKSAVQVSIRWLLQRGITTIPKSTHRERLLHNADVFDFVLSPDEMDTIAGLDRHERIGPDPEVFAALGR